MKDSVFRPKNTNLELSPHLHSPYTMAIVVLTLPSFRQSESRGIDACDTTAALSHSQSRPRSSLARFVGLSGILLLLSESRSKEVFISGGAIDPRLARSADAFRAKREAAKLCTTNGIKQRERGKRKGGREAGVPAAPRNRYFPPLFLSYVASVPIFDSWKINREPKTMYAELAAAANSHLPSFLLPAAAACTCEQPFLPKQAGGRARQEQSYKQSCNRK